MNNTTTWAAVLLAGTSICFGAWSCGGDDGPGASGGAAGAGGTAGDSGLGGAAGADAGLSECASVAVQTCQQRKACCEKTLGYVESKCVEYVTAACEEHSVKVAAGTHSHDAAKFEQCRSDIQKWLDQCEMGLDQYYGYLSGVEACREANQGPALKGESCTDGAADCKEPTGNKNWASCSAGACMQTELVGEGSACEQFAPVEHYCDVGLYCLAGLCVKATAPGQTCVPASGGFNFECGPGFWCNPDSAVCETAKQPGEDCSVLLECAGTVCESGKCGALLSPVRAEQCGVGS